MLSGELEQALEKAARKIAAVKVVMIRKSQLIQDGVIVEDGPTLDEIREDESRVAAAKKAAIAAAMDEESAEDETPDVLAAAEAAADDEDDTSDEEAEADSEDESTEEEVVEEEAADDAPDYASMKVAELKELLKAAGKPVSGKKDELIARLME